MRAHEYAQKCLDTDGFLILGSYIEYSVGSVIEVEDALYRNEFHSLKVVVVGTSTHADSVDQVRRNCDEEQFWKKPRYYKVVAE